MKNESIGEIMFSWPKPNIINPDGIVANRICFNIPDFTFVLSVSFRRLRSNSHSVQDAIDAPTAKPIGPKCKP